MEADRTPTFKLQGNFDLLPGTEDHVDALVQDGNKQRSFHRNDQVGPLLIAYTNTRALV